MWCHGYLFWVFLSKKKILNKTSLFYVVPKKSAISIKQSSCLFENSNIQIFILSYEMWSTSPLDKQIIFHNISSKSIWKKEKKWCMHSLSWWKAFQHILILKKYSNRKSEIFFPLSPNVPPPLSNKCVYCWCIWNWKSPRRSFNILERPAGHSYQTVFYAFKQNS